MADTLNDWRARCFQQACRARHGVRDFLTGGQADAWALGHAHNHGRGGHAVCVWDARHPELAHLLRYSDWVHPIANWLPGWAWACLGCPLDPAGHPAWHEGAIDRKAVIADWRDHDCTRGHSG